MLLILLNYTVFYTLLSLIILLSFFILLASSEYINQLWFSHFFTFICLRSAPYFAAVRKQLFSDISQLESSDPSLRSDNAIRILEVGSGTGPNFEYYPKNCRLITVDKNANFRQSLVSKIGDYPNIVLENAFVANGEDMRECVADGYCDAVVLTHILCSADDSTAILNEAYRTLKKGGVLYLLEHVRYGSERCFKAQRLIDPFWTRIFGGCHITQQINEQTLKSIGFRDINLEYCELNMSHPYLFWQQWFIQPHVVACATK